MRKVVYFVHQSADGFIEGPAGEFDWPTMGRELSDYSHELTDRADVFMYGRLVWDMMSSYWPSAETISDDPHDLRFAPVWRKTPKIVFSNTLTEADWNTRVIGGDIGARLAELKKEEGGELLLMGGSKLASKLTELGLIDEYHVVVHPVLLGGGKPVFAPADSRVRLRLVETRAFDGTTVLLRYDRV
ncbi:dihydrofolate reductase family protein [Phytomonospora sp. NPDC050363]|uniref:dihydrofolate reductase family protein n=1 Tax=Phytomonospora sp. NPDC050363 TaxID=3155642 RepID=UPI0033C23081